MRHRILQFCYNEFSHGSKYFADLCKNIDYALLQRLPIKNKLSLIDEIHLEPSISGIPDPLHVGVARLAGTTIFSSHTTYALPSTAIVKSTNKFQGSKAICTGIDAVVFCSVLPCYPDGGTITSEDTLKDIRFLLNKLKHTKCIIAGDFHHVPGEFKKLEDLIKDNGFTSYLDDHETYVSPEGTKKNLDRMLSNIPGLTIEDVTVHSPINNTTNHRAITYCITHLTL